MEIKGHLVYNNYIANGATGEYKFISKEKWLSGITKSHSGYKQMCFMHNYKKMTYPVHRFIWECYNGTVPDGYEISHINGDRGDNRLDNLQCIKVDENTIGKSGSLSTLKIRPVKAINILTGEEMSFVSKNQCAIYLGINPGLVYMVCEHKKHALSARSDRGRFRFEYIDDECDMKNLVVIPHGNLGRKHAK
jgi:hypothetical protein